MDCGKSAQCSVVFIVFPLVKLRVRLVRLLLQSLALSRAGNRANAAGVLYSTFQHLHPIPNNKQKETLQPIEN